MARMMQCKLVRQMLMKSDNAPLQCASNTATIYDNMLKAMLIIYVDEVT